MMPESSQIPYYSRKACQFMLFLASKSKKINNVNISLVLVADAAYPLLPWVMKPYQEAGNLSVERLYFNYRISRARMVVENAFGRLKGRWRCLLKQNQAGKEEMNSAVATCCVLHNICKRFLVMNLIQNCLKKMCHVYQQQLVRS